MTTGALLDYALRRADARASNVMAGVDADTPLDGYIGLLGLATMLRVVAISEMDKRREVQRNAAIQVEIERALNLAVERARAKRKKSS